MCDIYQKYFLFLRCEGSLRGDNKVMLIMSIGELANLPKQKREVEQKTNKLLILCVELILLTTSSHKRKRKNCISESSPYILLLYIDYLFLEVILTRQ